MNATKKSVVLVAICGLLSLSVTHAQETNPEVLRVDLETAIQIALSENPVVKIADMEIMKNRHIAPKKTRFESICPLSTP